MGSHVVVVGAGAGGITVAKSLSKSGLKVTLIAPTEYAEWSPGHIRSLVKPLETDRSIAPSLEACVEHATIVRGKAISVSASDVTVQGATGEINLTYDILVLATGGRYAHAGAAFLKSPDNATTFMERVAELQSKASELEAAQTVTIVGAGLAGIELACEICHAFPSKKVTLISRGAIGSMLHPKVLKQVLKHLAKCDNLTLQPNTELAVGSEPGADVVYRTIGFAPNTEFLKDGALASALTAGGLVSVSKTTLMVDGAKNVFALGDIITPGHMDEPFNSGYVVSQMAPQLARNLVRHAAGQPLKPMGKPPMTKGGMLSLGPTNGAGAFDKMVLPQCMVKMMKSKDLFRKKTIGAWKK